MPTSSSFHPPRAVAALVALASTLGAAPAWAHPGDHGTLGLLASLAHMASEPDHLALAAGAVAVGVLLARRVFARRRRGDRPAASSAASRRPASHRNR